MRTLFRLYHQGVHGSGEASIRLDRVVRNLPQDEARVLLDVLRSVVRKIEQKEVLPVCEPRPRSGVVDARTDRDARLTSIATNADETGR